MRGKGSRAARSRKGLAAVAALALAAGCASGPNPPTADAPPAPSYAELKAEELRGLALEDPSRALEAVSALFAVEGTSDAGDGPSSSDLQEIATEALDSIEASYGSALESGNFPVATARLDDLEAVAGDEKLRALMSPTARSTALNASASRSDMLVREADSFFARGSLTPAILLYLEALGEGGATRDGEELARWAERAIAAGDRRAARKLVEALATRGLPAPEGAEKILSSRDSVADMRSGVVTIRVDRGMKIEQGLGSPDRGLGSGFFIDSSGYVLTNYHVISSEVDPEYEGYSRLTVRIADAPEDRIHATVVGWDRLLDLALLKVDAKPKYVFSLSEGESLDPGQRIMAFGSPLGLVDTVTSGIVSAVGRRIVGMQTGDTLQVDVAINPGNSGGPVVDESGEVIGIAFAGLSQYQGLNFAIPSSWIIKDLPALFRGGEVKRPWLGVALAERSASSREPEGLEVTYRHPSAAGGIEEGDRILALAGRRPATIQEAQAFLMGRPVGSLIRVETSGDGGSATSLRYLGERPFAPFESAAKMDRKDRLFPALFGMSLRRLPSTLFESDNYSVAKVWPGTVADESGLSEDDPISLKRFTIDKAQRLAYLQIYVKKRKAGFLESVLQIPASLDSPDFL